MSSDRLRGSVKRIVSGGQTGADRAALDFAIERGLPHGGWCPKGGLAEDGVIPDQYNLRETPLEDYSQRTEWNVRDSDGTVIFSIAPDLAGGSLFTRQTAERLGKPWLHLHQGDEEIAAIRLQEFIRRNRIVALNVAGPRASQEPGIGNFVKSILGKAFHPAI